MELQNSTVLVTSATRSMGPYVVDQFANEGATVIGTYVSDTERTDSKARTDQSAAVSYYQVDLTNESAVEAFADTASNEHGTIDYIVGYAGGFSMGDISGTA